VDSSHNICGSVAIVVNLDKDLLLTCPLHPSTSGLSTLWSLSTSQMRHQKASRWLASHTCSLHNEELPLVLRTSGLYALEQVSAPQPRHADHHRVTTTDKSRLAEANKIVESTSSHREFSNEDYPARACRAHPLAKCWSQIWQRSKHWQWRKLLMTLPRAK
jgi:hypothetical protein